MAENNEANVDGTIEHESIPAQPTSLSNSGKKDKPPHPARLTAEGKKDSKLNLHSDGSPKSPSPYVGVRDEFTDWVPVFNKVGRGMTPLLDKKDSVLDQTSPTGQKGVIKEFQSPPIPTKKINYGNKDKGSYDDSDDELSPDDDNGTLPTFILRDSNKPTSGRQTMSEIVNSPRIPPAISDVPSSPRLIPQSPLIGPGGGKKNTIPPKPSVPASVQAPAPAPVPVFVPEKKQAPAPVQDPEPDSSTSEEEPVVLRKPAPKKAAAPPMRRQPSGNRLVPPSAMGAKPKTSANRLSSLASVSKRKQSMDSNYLKNLVGDDTEEEDTLVNSDREVKPKAEELIKELLRDQNMESSLKNFKAAFGDKWKRQALNAILPKTLYYDDEDDRLLVYNLVRRLKKAETLSVEDIETAFTNILEDLLKIIEGSSNAPIYLGELLAHGIVDRIIGGDFLNEELAREEIVKLGHSEVVMENMLRVLTNRDLRKRVEENNWNLSAFIKPEDMDLKTKEWLKSRGYGKIY